MERITNHDMPLLTASMPALTRALALAESIVFQADGAYGIHFTQVDKKTVFKQAYQSGHCVVYLGHVLRLYCDYGSYFDIQLRRSSTIVRCSEFTSLILDPLTRELADLREARAELPLFC